MRRQGIKPTIVTYSALISACEKGQDLTKALQLSEDLQRQGIKPTIVTYNALISACEKGEQPERAHKVFEVMQRKGVVPNAISIDSFILTGAASARLPSALALLAEFLTRS